MDLSMTTRRKARKLIKQLPEADFKFEVAGSSQQAGEFFDENGS